MITKRINRIVLFFVFMLLTIGCANREKSITIENTSNVDCKDKVISISWDKVIENYPWINGDNFKIINSKTNGEIVYQLENLAGEKPVNLLLQVSLKSNEKIELSFLKEKHSEFATKTYARYVPERYDDFAWENDKIAFRMYGKALELVPNQNAYGTDVWVKRTNKMIINERYKRGEYHIDHGDGMDYYHVGFTLGAGNCAPYVNDSIWYSKNYTKWKILDNGPLRTTFKLDFDTWDVAGMKVKATKTISLDAGSQLNKIKVQYTYNEGLDSLPIAIGIVKRPEDGFELLDKEKGVLGYWEPKHGDDGTTGVGVVIPSKINNMKTRGNQFIATIEVPKNKSFIYYAGAVWDRAGVITNKNQWFDYLENERQQLSDDGLVIGL
ncbi:DUF4861 family protein [Yeosuana marina]|uniref:DUF4861 family protein n=1 Tax=Yeosuana marina TaxID=1565536 RepID=UPI001F10F81D|nr:DUF4861 family protein [Yeosuana marina]